MEVADPSVVMSDDVRTSTVLDHEGPGTRPDAEQRFSSLVMHIPFGGGEDPERLRGGSRLARIRRVEISIGVGEALDDAGSASARTSPVS